MQCLNLKITYKCNNRCSYCFSSNMKNIKLDTNELKEIVKKAYQNGCRGLIISGGEPTLDSKRLIEIIEYSFKIGFRRYIIQTNGYGLANDNELLDIIRIYSKKTNMSISFSILGKDEKEHDLITKNKGSFKMLINSMKNIYNTSCDIYTNTVINAINKDSIEEIVKRVEVYEPSVIQLSVMHTEEHNELSIGLIESIKAIDKVKDRISKDILRTEGIPYCLMKGFEKCISESYWPSILDLYNGNDDYKSNFSQLECNMRWKSNECRKCILDDICHGIWYEQKHEFIELNVEPIR